MPMSSLWKEQLRLHAAWLRKEPNGEQLVLRGKVLPDLDAIAKDLSGAHLVKCCLLGSEFENAKLVNVCFNYSDLSRCTFSGTDMTGASLIRSELLGADFFGAILDKVVFSLANIENVEFRNCRFIGANFDSARLMNVSFEGCNLDGARLTTGELWGQSAAEVVPDLLDHCGLALISAKSWGDFPRLLGPRVQQFLMFFNSNLITEASVQDERLKALIADMKKNGIFKG